MMHEKNNVKILGVSVDARSKNDIYKDIEEILNARRGATIFTPNGEIIYKLQKDDALKKCFENASLSLPDGISVQIAARLLGKYIPERITGIDTAEFILKLAADKGLSVYLLGGEKGVADAAATHLKEKLPSLVISGVHHGYFTPNDEEEKALLREIRTKAPDILFVCIGSPAQEKWIIKNTPSLPSLRLSMGLGGSLDVWSGNKKRAPLALRSIGLEWLYRIFCEPSRITRLPYIAGYFLTVAKQALTRQPHGHRAKIRG